MSPTAQTWTLELSLADSETAGGGEEGYEENVETNSVFYRSEFGDELVSEHSPPLQEAANTRRFVAEAHVNSSDSCS